MIISLKGQGNILPEIWGPVPDLLASLLLVAVVAIAGRMKVKAGGAPSENAESRRQIQRVAGISLIAMAALAELIGLVGHFTLDFPAWVIYLPLLFVAAGIVALRSSRNQSD